MSVAEGRAAVTARRRGGGEINVMWDPSPKGYRSRTDVPFGRPVRIPAPFDFELDTSGFAVEEAVASEDEQR
ncbi:hypothetical protein [Streptomyces sp. NPDC050263]|uniref:hypothetical protein n=1 Tax=Streptomyces sp. NPDC050263 TaxID=3155037 RepID=UPI003441F2A8